MKSLHEQTFLEYRLGDLFGNVTAGRSPNLVSYQVLHVCAQEPSLLGSSQRQLSSNTEKRMHTHEINGPEITRYLQQAS